MHKEGKWQVNVKIVDTIMEKDVKFMGHVCRAAVVALTLQVILEVKLLLVKIVDFTMEKDVKSMEHVCQAVVVLNLVDTDKIY